MSFNTSIGSTGVTSAGTLSQLIAIGAADSHLTSTPMVTFWRLRTQKCTNFAMESIMQNFSGSAQWGSEVQLTLNRTGDLLTYMYVRLDIPGLEAKSDASVHVSGFPDLKQCNPCNDTSGMLDGEEDDEACGEVSGDYCHWVDSIGFAALERVAFSIGGQTIDATYSHYLHMWEELTGKPGKRLYEMIGKRFKRESLIKDSSSSRTLYVPLNFYFNQHSGLALPLVSLQFHSLQVHVRFSPLNKLIQRSSDRVQVINKETQSPITDSSLKAYLDTTYVYLDTEERDRFAVGNFSQLITQVQVHTGTICGSTHRANLNFNHPTLELIWAIQRDCHAKANNTFNYSGVDDKDPFTQATLKINGLPRFDREASYFRLVQPYQHHTNIPLSKIYNYSFALHPEDCQPSGSLNLSRIDNCELTVITHPSLCHETLSLMVVARNWNVVRYKEGLGGLLYSN